MILSDTSLFFGRFHPLIVHLPIGFLLMAALLQIAGYRSRFSSLRHAVPFTLLTGSISSILACISGYLLSIHGDYDPDALQTHLVAGITTALLSLLAYLVSIRKIPLHYLQTSQGLMVSVVFMIIAVLFTGHLGGGLTHGPEYLSTDVLFEKKREKKNIVSLADAFVFEDLVQPILRDKCGSCHNRSKMKGRLSLASFKDMDKGGKHGKVIVPGQPLASEMVKRISLDPKDEKFMPSDGKTPLTSGETAIIKWWIEKQAGTPDKKITEAKPPAEINNYAAIYFNLQPDDESSSADNAYINWKVLPIKEDDLNNLKRSGFAIKYIHFKPDLLDVTLPSPPKANPNANSGKLKELLALKENIVWLNIAENNITDTEMDIISQFKNLQRLKLDKNPITDKGIIKLKGLANLQSINLYNTGITKASLPELSKMENLKTVYAWGTGIKKEDLSTKPDSSMKVVMGSN